MPCRNRRRCCRPIHRPARAEPPDAGRGTATAGPAYRSPIVTAWTVRDAQERDSPAQRRSHSRGRDARHPGLAGLAGWRRRHRRPDACARGADPAHAGDAAQLPAGSADLAAASRAARPRAGIDRIGAAGAGADRRIALADRRADGQPRLDRLQPRGDHRAQAGPAAHRRRRGAVAGGRTGACADRASDQCGARARRGRQRRPRQSRACTGAGGARSVADGDGAQCRSDHRLAAGQGGRRAGGDDVHPAAARGPARPADPPVRRPRPASHDARDQRCRDPVEPLFHHPACGECRFRLRHRRRAVRNRRPESAAVGHPLGAAAFRAVFRLDPGGGVAGAAGGGDFAGLDHGDRGRAAVLRDRAWSSAS